MKQERKSGAGEKKKEVSQQRSEEFRRAAVEKFQNRGSRSVEEVGRVLPNRPLQPIQSTVQARATDLLKQNLRLTSLLLWLIWFALPLGYYGTFTWLPSFLGVKMGTLDCTRTPLFWHWQTRCQQSGGRAHGQTLAKQASGSPCWREVWICIARGPVNLWPKVSQV